MQGSEHSLKKRPIFWSISAECTQQLSIQMEGSSDVCAVKVEMDRLGWDLG